MATAAVKRLSSGKVELGRLVMTCGINERVARDPGFAAGLLAALARHAAGDWGEVCREDWCENERSLLHGWRLLSSYTVGGEKVWIITEWDRSVTTVLFPSEY